VKVGLVRHFRVKHDYPRKLLVTPDEVADWFLGYDAADIEYGHVDLSGGNWQHCFCSDLPRAIKTAQAIFKGDIVVLEDLREIEPYPFRGNRIKLPFIVWGILVRLVWYFKSHPNVETKRAVRERVRRVIDQVLRANGDALIVSHAALMPFLRAELKRRGFRGPWFGRAANGLLYLFERS
jgi:broad specificity phosphatase PhoE